MIAALLPLPVPTIGMSKISGLYPMKVGRSFGPRSSRLMSMIPTAPAAWAAAPLSTNAQTPRWMATIVFGARVP